MFSKVSNAFKLVLIDLAKNKNYKLIDCQIHNEHLSVLVAVQIDRDLVLSVLKR